MKKEIIVDISEDGEVHIETVGFEGKSCITETCFLKAVIGKETFSQLTPAYYVNQHIRKKKYLSLCG